MILRIRLVMAKQSTQMQISRLDFDDRLVTMMPCSFPINESRLKRKATCVKLDINLKELFISSPTIFL